MKGYNEEETKELRKAFEKEVLKWPQVDFKKNVWMPLLFSKRKDVCGNDNKRNRNYKVIQFGKK